MPLGHVRIRWLLGGGMTRVGGGLLVALAVLFVHVSRGYGQAGRAMAWDEWIRLSPWVFLGDSNTFAGHYVAEIDARLHQSLGGRAPRVLNLGVASETASGASEPDHPFPRPWVHQRLEKVLRMLQPQVVFLCYGMNDGVYAPPTDENFAAYRDGMLKLVAHLRASGAAVVCLTPPPFEPEPLAARGRLGPTPDGRYAYFAPFPGYHRVVERQAAWCVSNEMHADLVIDLYRLLHEFRATQREQDPGFHLTSDGIHFGPVAHREVGTAVLRHLGAPADVVDGTINQEMLARYVRRMTLLRDAYLTATGKNRPGLPAGIPPWQAEQLAEQMRSLF
ncbi:MAG: hypothetical protein KatS3mg111_2282 [Pirellulaceae bacterium]|nr:MAG: hypothetical protein KatS3mg111_2282 [Pirellulaceae bacterium]